MTHDELVDLIKAGVPTHAAAATWADFGAGRGAFTRALRDLLGHSATLYAVDRDRDALRTHPADVQTIHSDFTAPLDLPPLDGLLVANALHFVLRQGRVIERLAEYLKPGGHLLIVEYDRRLPWTPFPLPYPRFQQLAGGAGLTQVGQLATRTSPRNGVIMYAAQAIRPSP